MQVTNYNYRVLSFRNILLTLCIGIIGSLLAQETEVCTNPVDIFFLIDGSGSLGEEEFIRSKQLVSEILSLYDHSAQNKAGYAVFTANINNVRYLTPEINYLLVHLEFEQYPGTSTDLYNALQFVHQNVFTHTKSQENAQRVLVVFTDGKDDRNVAELSRKLEVERGVRIIVFAFGNNLNQAQLEDIATDPDNKTLFTFPTVSEGIDSIQMLSKAICPDTECCSRGKEGKRGPRGLEGVFGDKGEMGRSGICKMRDPACTKRLRKGEKGYRGQRGPQGPTGTNGFRGFGGIHGLQGDQGEKGPKGYQGNKGEVGEKGEKGIMGEVGPIGETGQKGDKGIKGDVGPQGPKGIKGEVGPIGVCRNSTFDTEFSCKGQKGEQGVIGPKGIQGPTGDQGVQGSKGVKGVNGTKGDKGEQGLQGNKGDQGVKGDPLPYKSYNSTSCSEPGSLYFDPTDKLMYYCDGASMTHKCIGPGNTGSCHDCQCVLESGEVMQCNETKLIFREASDCNSNIAVDFVVIVDDSSGNAASQQWVNTNLPILNQKLLDKCVGRRASAPNLVQLIAFGSGVFFQYPHFVTPDSAYVTPDSTAYTSVPMRMNQLVNAINMLQNQIGTIIGYIEPGYDTLNFALEHAILRRSTNNIKYIPMFLFVTDEQTNDYTEAGFESILEKFRQRSSLVLEFIVNPLKFNTLSIDNLFGVAYSNAQDMTIWSLNDTDTVKSITASGSVQVYPRLNRPARYVKRDYMDLAMCTQSVSTHVWNMEPFVSTDTNLVDKVSQVFLKETTDAIIELAVEFSCQQCYCNGTTEIATCVQLEEKLLCDCIASSDADRRCPCVRDELQKLIEGMSQLNISEIKLVCNIESPRVDIDVCRGFLVEAT